MESRLHLEESAYYITSTLLIQRPLFVFYVLVWSELCQLNRITLHHSLCNIDINTLMPINAFTQNMNALIHVKMHKATLCKHSY